MSEQDIALFAEQLETRLGDKISNLFDRLSQNKSVEGYKSSMEIIEYFDIDKNTFHKLLKKGLPMLKVGGRWKGKISEIENWFKTQSDN